MKIKTKKINDYTREIDINVQWSEIKSDFENSLKKFSKNIKMPGFRSGRMPRERLLAIHLKPLYPSVKPSFGTPTTVTLRSLSG